MTVTVSELSLLRGRGRSIIFSSCLFCFFVLRGYRYTSLKVSMVDQRQVKGIHVSS